MSPGDNISSNQQAGWTNENEGNNSEVERLNTVCSLVIESAQDKGQFKLKL